MRRARLLTFPSQAFNLCARSRRLSLRRGSFFSLVRCPVLLDSMRALSRDRRREIAVHLVGLLGCARNGPRGWGRRIGIGERWKRDHLRRTIEREKEEEHGRRKDEEQRRSCDEGERRDRRSRRR